MTAMMEDKGGPVMGYRGVAVLSALLIILEAVLAGQFIGGEHGGLKDVHRIIGDVLILTVAGQTVLAFLARRTFGIGLVMHNASMLVLTFAQVGLGEAGSDQTKWHIPLGVLLFGMACAAAMLGFFDLKSQRRIN
jgi:hypothetical protein